LLQKINKLFIAFREWSKHLKQERIQLQNHLKLSQTHKTVFCYDLKTNNRLNVRINRLFWFDSKSTTKNSFQPFLKHLRLKQSVVSTKQQVVFHLV